jgi:hypothetical protein
MSWEPRNIVQKQKGQTEAPFGEQQGLTSLYTFSIIPMYISYKTKDGQARNARPSWSNGGPPFALSGAQGGTAPLTVLYHICW